MLLIYILLGAQFLLILIIGCFLFVYTRRLGQVEKAVNKSQISIDPIFRNVEERMAEAIGAGGPLQSAMRSAFRLPVHVSRGDQS